MIAYSSPFGSPASTPNSYGGYYAYPSTASPFSSSLSPATPLFGIQTTPAAYSPSPRLPAASPGPVPYYSPPVTHSPLASPSTLFGSTRVSPPAVASPSPYTSPAPYAPKAYGAAPNSPAISPGTSPGPYYGAPTSGRDKPPHLNCLSERLSFCIIHLQISLHCYCKRSLDQSCHCFVVEVDMISGR